MNYFLKRYIFNYLTLIYSNIIMLSYTEWSEWSSYLTWKQGVINHFTGIVNITKKIIKQWSTKF